MQAFLYQRLAFLLTSRFAEFRLTYNDFHMPVVELLQMPRKLRILGLKFGSKLCRILFSLVKTVHKMLPLGHSSKLEQILLAPEKRIEKLLYIVVHQDLAEIKNKILYHKKNYCWAPPAKSRISAVILAWRPLLYSSVSSESISLPLSVAICIATVRAACSAALLSRSTE